MAHTLQQLKESVERLIEQQGNDAPVAYWIYTNEDVFVMDEDNNPDPVSREIAETVLNEVEEYDHIYTEIADTIEAELKAIQWYYVTVDKVAHWGFRCPLWPLIIDSYHATPPNENRSPLPDPLRRLWVAVTVVPHADGSGEDGRLLPLLWVTLPHRPQQSGTVWVSAGVSPQPLGIVAQRVPLAPSPPPIIDSYQPTQANDRHHLPNLPDRYNLQWLD